MKKRLLLWSLPAVLAVAAVMTTLTACSDDDEDGGLVGTWVLWEYDQNDAGGYVYSNKQTWEFYSDGSGVFTTEGSQYIKSDAYRDDWRVYHYFNYTATGGNSGKVMIEVYSTKGDNAHIYFYEGSTFVWDYTVKDKQLTMDGKVYVPEELVQEPVAQETEVTEPEVSIVSATASAIEFNVSIKVESEEWPDYCTLYYQPVYYNPEQVPTSFQSKACRQTTDSEGTSGKHAYYYEGWAEGFAGAPAGSRIYYYVEVKNRAGITTTPIQYVTLRASSSY